MSKINMAEMYHDSEIINAVTAVINSGNYIKGEQNKGLEAEFAEFCGAKHAAAVNSGTNALILALKCLDIKPGDEVIVPSHTFIATANAVIFCGGKPVFADILPDTYTIDPEDIARKVTKKTKGIIPVHIYGHPCEMDEIGEIASEKDLFVVEDSCQAHGAKYKGKKIGSIGDIAAFSFFPSKNMTVAGDGGAITTNNDELYEMACALRDQGRKEGEKYYHDYPGLNLRLSEIHAAIGRVQLKHLPEWNKIRRANASEFTKFMTDCGYAVPPSEKSYSECVYHQYVIRVQKREELQKFLKEEGIATGIHYPLPVHQQPAMKGFADPVKLPVTEKIAPEILSIPVHPYLSADERSFIMNKIKEFYS